jgi:hypothetical protein
MFRNSLQGFRRIYSPVPYTYKRTHERLIQNFVPTAKQCVPAPSVLDYPKNITSNYKLSYISHKHGVVIKHHCHIRGSENPNEIIQHICNFPKN